MRSHIAGMTKIGFDPRPLDDIGTDAVQRILDALGSEVTSATLDKEDLADPRPPTTGGSRWATLRVHH